MKVYYDDEVDALYLRLGDAPPEGVVEISEGVNLDPTSEEDRVCLFKNPFLMNAGIPGRALAG